MGGALGRKNGREWKDRKAHKDSKKSKINSKVSYSSLFFFLSLFLLLCPLPLWFMHVDGRCTTFPVCVCVWYINVEKSEWFLLKFHHTSTHTIFFTALFVSHTSLNTFSVLLPCKDPRVAVWFAG